MHFGRSIIATAAFSLLNLPENTTGFSLLSKVPAFREACLETPTKLYKSQVRLFSTGAITMATTKAIELEGEEWRDVLPMEKSSHNSVRIKIPSTTASSSTNYDESDDPFGKSSFQKNLASTIEACRELGKSSLWVEVPMDRASLIQDMKEFGLRFHHAFDETAVLNIWLLEDSESKIPEFATHNVGVGAVVVNSRDEILLVRELRKNYMPWKTPTGITELGEQLDEAVTREVMEETGIETTFHSILGFRQTHGLKHGRSDLFFVCRLDPKEVVDSTTGNVVMPEPVPQENEIERAEWIPLKDYLAMIHDEKTGGHPTMRHIMNVFDEGRKIEKLVVESVVPGRKPNTIYFPTGQKD